MSGTSRFFVRADLDRVGRIYQETVTKRRLRFTGMAIGRWKAVGILTAEPAKDLSRKGNEP